MNFVLFFIASCLWGYFGNQLFWHMGVRKQMYRMLLVVAVWFVAWFFMQKDL